MTRPIKPAANPHTALLRVRLARERTALAEERREERKKARAAKAHADKLAQIAKDRAVARLEARIAAGGFGRGPRTPQTDAVRERIDEAYAAKHGW